MKKAKMKFEIFRDGMGAYRWRLLSSNNRIIADSGQGYTSKAALMATLRKIIRHAGDAEIVYCEISMR